MIATGEKPAPVRLRTSRAGSSWMRFHRPTAAAEGVDEHLAAVGGGLVGVSHLEVQFGFSLRKERHGMYITITVIYCQQIFHLKMHFSSPG